MKMRIFGPKPWGPALPLEDPERCEFVATPAGEQCLICEEAIENGEEGAITLYQSGEGPKLVPQHRECMLATTVGHAVGACSCTMPDATMRERAHATVERVDAGALGKP